MIRQWTQGDVKLAHAIIDWYQLWGSDPVSFDKWYERLHNHVCRRSADRTWSRFKGRLVRAGYVFDIMSDPLSHHGGHALAIQHDSYLRAQWFLDDVDVSKKLNRRKREQDRVRRRRLEREEARLKRVLAGVRKRAPKRKRQTSAVA